MAKHDDIAQEIKARIQANLNPERLEIINESHLHAGHKEAKKNSGAGHFRVIIQASELQCKSRITQHRQINALVADMMPSQIHALSIEVQ